SRQEIQTYAMADSQILDPKNGSLIVAPTQDIILGIYYLTRNSSSSTDKILLYHEVSQIEKDYANRRIDYTTPFFIPLCLFNQILPPGFPYYINDLNYYNKHQNSPAPEDIVELPFSSRPEEISQEEMVEFLDQLKDLGFAAATQSGISISLFDLPKITEKEQMLQQRFTKLSQLEEHHEQGFYNEEEFTKQKNNL
ncbi:12416_t:CDS:2, partial [Racocetra persica]